MAIEEKLDQIIEILLRIEKKLNPTSESVIDAPIQSETEQPILFRKPPKPTKSQLEFQGHTEFGIRLYRTQFLTGIRQEAAELMELKEKHPGIKILSFRPERIIESIDEKIARTQAIFYKDLREWAFKRFKVIEEEGEQTLDRAIARLTARLK